MNRIPFPRMLCLAMTSIALASSCANIGTKRVLFYTRSNVGVDISSTPATLDVTIARKEGVLEPVFEGGKTLPVVASFRSDVSGPLRIFTGVAMTFATADAALALTYNHGEDASLQRSTAGAQVRSAEEDSTLQHKTTTDNPYDATLSVRAGSSVLQKGTASGDKETTAQRLDKTVKKISAAAKQNAEAKTSDERARAQEQLHRLVQEQELLQAQKGLEEAEAELAKTSSLVADENSTRAEKAAYAQHRAAAQKVAAARREVEAVRARSGVGPGGKSSGFFPEIDVSELQPPGKASPLFFATDSTLGLKVGFDANVPTSFVFGFNRKELALAPVTATPDGDGGYTVAMPAVLASVNGEASAADKAADLKYQQYFATGRAASYLALDGQVREAFSKKLVPATSNPDLGKTIQRTLLSHLYSELGRIAADPNESAARRAEAKRLVAEMDALAGAVTADVSVYEKKKSAKESDIRLMRKTVSEITGTPTENLVTYMMQAETGAQNLADLIGVYDKEAQAQAAAKAADPKAAGPFGELDKRHKVYPYEFSKDLGKDYDTAVKPDDEATRQTNLDAFDAAHFKDLPGVSTQLDFLRGELKTIRSRIDEVNKASGKRMGAADILKRAEAFALGSK